MNHSEKQIMNSNSIKPKIYPFIDELVNILYTDDLNNLIDSEHVQIDKRNFFMFIIMYFTTRLYASNESLSKENMKLFMTDLIRDPIKRNKCIQLFLMFENSLGNMKLLL
jgi:hypothetical protein